MADRSLAILTLLALTAIAPARGADIAYVPVPGGGSLITITGDIVDGDLGRFKRMGRPKPPVTVSLTSPGGELFTALQIGETINKLGWSTYVPAGQRCSSACADIWMGGVKRTLGTDAMVGFHPPACTIDGKPDCTEVMKLQSSLVQAVYWQRMHMPEAVAKGAMTGDGAHMMWMRRVGETYQFSSPENQREWEREHAK